MKSARIRTAAAALLALTAPLSACSHLTVGHPVAGHDTAAVTTPSVESVPEPPPPPPPPSDEDQIRQAVQIYQDAYNTENWDAYREIMCPAMREQFTGAVMDVVKKTRADNGLTNAVVTATEIDGDSAVATIDSQNELLGPLTITLPLERSDGWKICKVS